MPGAASGDWITGVAAPDPASTLRSRSFVAVHTGLGSGPLIIVGVVVAYLTVQAIDPRPSAPQPATAS
jgi:hypothetical protein